MIKRFDNLAKASFTEDIQYFVSITKMIIEHLEGKKIQKNETTALIRNILVLRKSIVSLSLHRISFRFNDPLHATISIFPFPFLSGIIRL